MDDRQFDVFVRRLSSGLTRRRVVGLFGGALGAVVASSGDDAASASKKKQCIGGCGVCERCKRGKCKVHVGATCGSGGKCLSNGSCALAWNAKLQDCPASCPAGCSFRNAEGRSYCIQANDGCEDVPQECKSTKNCPVGQQCQKTICGAKRRCCPLCSL